MTKSKKDKSIVEDVETQTKLPVASIMITALDPVYTSGMAEVIGRPLSYGFIVTLDGVTHTFRTNVQGELQLNNSGNFNTHFTLN
jgi:hypothetical protein